MSGARHARALFPGTGIPADGMLRVASEAVSQ